jgi:hypothetical protein
MSAERRSLRYLILIPIILLALALNLHALESKSLWFDELGTLTAAGWGGSWLDAIRPALTVPTLPKPPLFFLVTHAFLMLGDRVFLLRLPAVLFATLTVPLTYVLGRTLFDERVGLLGALLLAIAPLQIRYAQEARMYSLLAFLSMLSLYLYWRAVRSGRYRWWLGFALVTVLNLYTHLFAFLVLGVLGLFALGRWARSTNSDPIREVLRRVKSLNKLRSPEPESGHSRARPQRPFPMGPFVVAVAVILVLYLPMAPFFARGLASDDGLGGADASGWDLPTVVAAVRLFSGGNYAGLVVHACLVAVAIVTLAVKRRDVVVLALLWVILPAALVLALPLGHSVLLRYFLFSLPMYLLLAACGLRRALRESVAWLGRLRYLAKRRVLTEAAVTTVLLAALAAISAPTVAAYYAETKQDWRDATWLVETRAKPGDVVFVPHVYQRMGVLFYAGQWADGPNLLTEENVQVLPADPAVAFPLADECGRWLVVPGRERFLPGGWLDTSIEPYHFLRPPIVLSPVHIPKDSELIGPIGYRDLAVMEVATSKPPFIQFVAGDASIANGSCTWLRWKVENVREIYLDGDGVVGYGERQVCPTTSTSYTLEVIHLDGSTTTKTIEIQVPE